MFIIFYLKVLTDNILYMTSDMQNYSIMGYKKFKEFVFSFKPYDGANLLKEINSFETIMLDTESREWITINPDHSGVTDEELRKLNEKSIVVKDSRKDKEKTISIYDYFRKKSSKVLDKMYGLKNNIEGDK